MTIEDLAAIAPEDRNAEIHKHGAWLETLNETELDEVGRLLCHGSKKHVREEYPIIGDLPTKQRVAQEQFEDDLFGVKSPKRGDLPVE